MDGEPDANIAVELVWIPMWPTDSMRNARKAARRLDDARIRHYYDGQFRLGLAYMRDVFPDCIRDAISVLPERDPLRQKLEETLARPGNPELALWDAALGYRAGVRWDDRIPMPAYWSKQIGFWGPGKPGEPSGSFWRNDCKQLPTDSDWAVELRNLMNAIGINGSIDE